MISDDLTKGQISHHFRTLAVPAAFGMLFATLYNVVDIFFAGMLGTYAQAGLANGYQAFFIRALDLVPHSVRLSVIPKEAMTYRPHRNSRVRG
jgi:hypothetical protein